MTLARYKHRQSNALHHKGHNAHLLHVLLPQRRSWPSEF